MELREKIARAIADYDRDLDCVNCPDPWCTCLEEGNRIDYLECADAIIENIGLEKIGMSDGRTITPQRSTLYHKQFDVYRLKDFDDD